MKDPCFAVVYEAVKALSRRERRTDDFRLWMWYCHRIGYNTLLDQLCRLESEMATDRLEGRTPFRNPAAVYHRRLKSIYYSDGTCRWREVKQVPKTARKRRERPEVSPDTFVTCPECGCEFRVHKRS